jgi:hypothetical protein
MFGQKPFRAVWNGFLIITNNILKVIILATIIEIIQLIPLIIFITAISFTPIKSHISSPLSLNFITYRKLFSDLVIRGAIQVLYVLIWPLSSTVWVIAYNQFTSEISYPGLASRGEDLES